MPGCTFCRVTMIVIIGIAGVIVGAIVGPPLAAALGIKGSAAALTNWSEVIGGLIALGIGVDDLAAYICCNAADCKDYCPKGATQFWTDYGAAIQRTHGHLTQDDCRALRATINGLVMRGQIDDATAESLKTALHKRCSE